MMAASVGLLLLASHRGRCRSFAAIVALDFVLMTFIVLGIKPLVDPELPICWKDTCLGSIHWQIIYALKNILTITLLWVCAERLNIRIVCISAAAIAMVAELSYFYQYYAYALGWTDHWSGYYLDPYYFTIMLTVSIIQLCAVWSGIYSVRRATSRIHHHSNGTSFRYFYDRPNFQEQEQ